MTMTLFGIRETEAVAAVRDVTGEELTGDAVREQLARAAWSGVCEGGDGVAGLLVAGLGAAAALEMVMAGRTAAELTAALRITIGGDVAELPFTERDIRLGVERWQPRLSPQAFLRSLHQARRHGVKLLTPASPLWPSGMADLGSYSPMALWLRGADLALAALEDSIALVGSRAATGYGEHVSMEFSAGLVDRGYSIVSGAAYGIDAAAHRAALASDGVTVAFLAGGVDRLYPSGNETMLLRMIEHGAILSEMPCGTAPSKWRFLRRNRLIAAASLATIVVEAGARSGAMNTANHALTLGRPLGAVPGPVTSAASAGTHRLLREYGAICVTSADDVAELAPIAYELGPIEAAVESISDAPAAPRRLGDRPSLELRVLDSLSTHSPRVELDVAARCGLSARVVRTVLARLAADDSVTARDGGWVVA